MTQTTKQAIEAARRNSERLTAESKIVQREHTAWMLTHRRVSCPAWREHDGVVAALYSAGCLVMWADGQIEYVRTADVTVGRVWGHDPFTGVFRPILSLPHSAFSDASGHRAAWPYDCTSAGRRSAL